MFALISRWLKACASPRGTVLIALVSTLAVPHASQAEQVRDYIYLGSQVIGSTDSAATALPTGATATPTIAPTPTMTPVPSGTPAPDLYPFGSLDVSQCNIFQGWACDPSNATWALPVHFYADNDTLWLGVAIANQFRSDVARACGGTIDSAHAFNFVPPDSLRDGQVHTVTAYAINVDPAGYAVGVGNIRLATPQPTPVPIQCAAPAPSGHYDAADCTWLSGWACDGSNYSVPLTVKVYEGTTLLGTTTANAVRTDLSGPPNDVCHGYNAHAFGLLVPNSLKNGQPHTTSVHAMNIDASGNVVGEFTLPGNPGPITCAAPTATATPTPTSTPTPTATATGSSPIGSFAVQTDCNQVLGWTCDLDVPSQSLTVELYKNAPYGAGGVFVASTTANTVREAAVASACGGVATHGFSFTTPSSLKDGGAHDLYAYAINIPGGEKVLLAGSPRSVTCAGTAPIAQWNLDETSGTTAADATGNGNTGSLINSPTWTSGVTGGGLSFNAAATPSPYVSVPDSPYLEGMATLTVSTWLKVSQLGAQAYVPVGKGASYQLVVGSGGLGHFVVQTTANGWYTTGTTAGWTQPLQPNVWYHVAGTYDGTTVRVYINGALAGTGASSISGAIVGSTQPLYMGYNPAANTDYFSGTLDDVRIYRRALSAIDIQAIVQRSLVAQWKLDETSGTTAADATGNGNTGTLVNGPTWTTGVAAGGLSFNGSATPAPYVTVPDRPSLDGMANLTLSTWVKMSQLPVQNYVPVGKDSSYQIVIGSSGTGHFVVQTTANGSYTAGTIAPWSLTLVPGVWYHIVGTYDGSMVRVYINGALAGTGASAISGAIVDSTSSPSFGYKPATNTDYLSGALDDVRVYRRALPATEVQTLFQATPPNNSPIGNFNTADCTQSVGWTCDLDDSSQSLAVHFYKNAPYGAGGVFVGSTTASVTREAAVANACGGVATHGFTFTTPSSLKDGGTHTLYAYGINYAGGQNVLLGGSPKSVTCSGTAPVAQWNLDETSGTTAADATGNGNTGSLVNNPAWTSGVVGGGLSFNAAATPSPYVSVPDSPYLEGMGTLSVSTWLKVSQLGAQAYVPVGKGASYQLVVGSGGLGHFVVQTTANGWYTAGTTATWAQPLQPNVWYHIAGTYDGTTVRVYVNGALAGTGANSISGAIVGSTQPLYMGYKPAANTDYFSGALDDVRVYRRALSAADVQALYQAP